MSRLDHRGAPMRSGPMTEKKEDRAMDDATALTEKVRIYDFGAHNVTLEDVTELVVRPSGTHRVKTADGKLHVIATGWLAIHIDDGGKGWTV